MGETKTDMDLTEALERMQEAIARDRRLTMRHGIVIPADDLEALIAAARDGLSAQRLMARVAELEAELATERRTANQSLADEYDARKRAETRVEKAREVLEERCPQLGHASDYEHWYLMRNKRALAALMEVGE